MLTNHILIGPAEEEIKTHLSQSGDPLEAIQAIQKGYGLDIQTIESLYPLLDLSGYSRAEIHQTCLNALNGAIITKIKDESFTLQQFHEIFDRLLPYINNTYLQPVIMVLLEKFEPDIDPSVMEKLKSDKSVFMKCPVNVKRRIWKSDVDFFQQQMLQILNEYYHDEKLREIAENIKPESFSQLLETRRQHPIVDTVMDMIGEDQSLYTMFLDMIRLVFEATPYPSLCALRVDVLMRFHTNNVEEICDLDKCHRFIWSLDACVKNHNIDEVIISKIKECFDGVANGTGLYSDFAMVTMDPIISNYLAACIVDWLRVSVEEGAPDNLEDLINYNAKLLNLAEHAPSAVANKTKIPKLDKDIKSHYWNALCAIIVDEGLSTASSYTADQEKFIQAILMKSEVARKVFVAYTLNRTSESDIATLSRVLKLLGNTMPNKKDEDPYNIQHIVTYQSFLTTFIRIVAGRFLVKIVLDRHWRKVVMEGFLLKQVAWDVHVHEHVVKMLAEYFLDIRHLTPLGDQVSVLTTWAEQCFEHGNKDEKNLQSLQHEYMVLLVRSEKLHEGQFQIKSPNIEQFCSTNLPNH